MPANPERDLKALNEWAGRLACPACLSVLHLKAATIVCEGCGRIYLVVDGIPVLIVERAEITGGLKN